MHLYISDLDQTLLNNDAQISPYALEELNKMIANGLHFTIATARSQVSAKYILNGLNLKLPVIVGNGSFLSDFHTGEIIYMQDIGNALKKDILDSILSEGISPFISANRNGNLKLFYHQINNPGLQWYLNDLIHADDKRREQLSNIHDGLDASVVSFTIIEKEDIAKKLGEKLNRQFPNLLDIHYYENPYDAGWFWMSIHDKKATKGNMIQKYVEYSDYQMDQVSVFGDNVNDIPMFEITGNGFAVSNAVDTLKEKSVGIIGSNMENGVIEYIKSKFYE